MPKEREKNYIINRISMMKDTARHIHQEYTQNRYEKVLFAQKEIILACARQSFFYPIIEDIPIIKFLPRAF